MFKKKLTMMIFFSCFILFFVLACIAFFMKRMMMGSSLLIVSFVFLVLGFRTLESFQCSGMTCPASFPDCRYEGNLTSWKWNADGTIVQPYSLPDTADPSLHYLFRGRFPYSTYCSLCNTSQKDAWATALNIFTQQSIQNLLISEIVKMLTEQRYALKTDSPYEIVVLGDQPPIRVSMTNFEFDGTRNCDTGIATSKDSVLLHIPLTVGIFTVSNLNFVIRLKDNPSVMKPIANSMTVSINDYPISLGVIMNTTSKKLVLGFVEFGHGYTGTPTIVCPKSDNFAKTLQGLFCYTSPSLLDIATSSLENVLFTTSVFPLDLEKDLGLTPTQVDQITNVFNLFIATSTCNVPSFSTSKNKKKARKSTSLATTVGDTDCHNRIDYYTFMTSMVETIFSTAFFAVQNYPSALIKPPSLCSPNQCAVPVFSNETVYNNCCTTGSDFRNINLNCLLPLKTVAIPDLWYNLRKYLDVSTGLAFTVPWTMLFGKPGKDARDVDKEFFLGKKALAPPLVKDLHTTVNAYYRDDWCSQSIFKDFACYDAAKCCDASDPTLMKNCPCIVPPVFSAPILYNWYDVSVCGLETTGLDFSSLTMTQIIACGAGLTDANGCNTENSGSYNIIFDSNLPVTMRLKALVQSKAGAEQVSKSDYNMLNYIQSGTSQADFDVTLSFPKLRVILKNAVFGCSTKGHMSIKTASVEIPGLLERLEDISDTDPSINRNYKTLLNNMFTVPADIIAEAVTMYILIAILYLLLAIFSSFLVPLGPIVAAVSGIAFVLATNVFFLGAVLAILQAIPKTSNIVNDVPKIFTSSWLGGMVMDAVFGPAVDIIQTQMTSTLNTLLHQVDIPTCFPASKIVDNDIDCICRNLCARNWANKLGTDWKNATCGQTYRKTTDASGNVSVDYQSCVAFPDTTSNDPNVKVEYKCMCMEEKEGQYASNNVSNCNDPLYVKVVDNSVAGASCDVFCQQFISTALPSWKGSYCLGAFKPSDKSPVPCFLPSTEPIQCMCYKDDSLYIPNTNSEFTIYGNLPTNVQRMLNWKGVHIINLVNNKYIANMTDASGNRVVDGMPLSVQQLVTSSLAPQTPLQRNLYGERSIWQFSPVTVKNLSSIPNLYSIQNFYDSSYLTDPNDVLPINLPTTSIQEILKNTKFEKLTLSDTLDTTNYRMVWKVLYQGGAYLFVNCFTNRCILAAKPDFLPTLQNPSLLVQDSSGTAEIGMVGAPGSYLMYDSINEWKLVAAQVMPNTELVPNEVQVYNLVNLGYQDCLSVINFSNVVMEGINLPGQPPITFPTTNYVCGFPFPPINTLPISQLYLHPVGQGLEDSYTIRVLTTTANLCLYENAGKLALGILDDPSKKEFQWVIKLPVNDEFFSARDKIRILKYNKTMNVIRNASTNHYLVHGDDAFTDLQQFLDNLSKGVPNFNLLTHDQLNFSEHAFLWTFQKTNPLVNPVNNYRANIACAAGPLSSTPSLCNTSPCASYTAPTTSYSGVNILNNNITGSAPRCVTNVSQLLKAYTPGTVQDQVQWQATVDTNISQGNIPFYTHLTSPCNLYGNTTQFDLVPTGKGSTYTIKNTDNLCLGVDSTNQQVSTSTDCSSPGTQWNIFPTQGTEGNDKLFSYASDFVLDSNDYFLVCACQQNTKFFLGIMTYATDTHAVTVLPNDQARTYFSAKTIDTGASPLYAMLRYTQDESLEENYLQLSNLPNQYLQCPAPPSTIQEYSLSQECLRCPDFNTSTVPAVMGAEKFALEFIMIANNVYGDNDVYGYLVRTKTTYTIQGKQYKGYLFNNGDTSTLSFLMWPFSGNKYSYVYNLDTDLQCLFDMSSQRVVWSFQNVQYISQCSSSSTRFMVKNDPSNLCWAMDSNPFKESGIPSVKLETCDGSKPSQAFLFQNSQFNPQNFPFIPMS